VQGGRHLAEPGPVNDRPGSDHDPGSAAVVDVVHEIRDLRDLMEKGVLTEREHTEIAAARDFLWRVRNALHFLSGQHQDQLTFEFQERIAADLGYRDAGHSKGVEQFMRAYYLHARTVNRFSDDMIARCLERSSPYRLLGRLGGRSIREGVRILGNELVVGDPATFRDDPAMLLRVFSDVQRHHVGQVLTRIAVLGQLGGRATRLQEAGVGRSGERRHLFAGVVDVILARDDIAGGGEQPRDHVPDDCAAAGSDVQRAGWIGTDEFYQDALSRPERRPAVIGALDILQTGLPEARREAEVEVPGPGDLDVRQQPVAVLDVRDDRLGDGARRPPLGACQPERHRRGQVAEACIPRHLEKQRGEAFQLQRSPLLGSVQRVLKQPLKPTFHPPPASATRPRPVLGTAEMSDVQSSRTPSAV